MNVKQLREALTAYPDDMHVITNDTFCNEIDGYKAIELETVRVMIDGEHYEYSNRPSITTEVLYIS
jgi:hypothetical protein